MKLETIQRLEDLNNLNDTHMLLLQKFLKEMRPISEIPAYKSLYWELVVSLNHLEHVSEEFNNIIVELI